MVNTYQIKSNIVINILRYLCNQNIELSMNLPTKSFINLFAFSKGAY